jgi:hypothetical protein
MMERQVRRKPGFGVRFAMGLVLIPLGIALRVMTQIYLEITREAVHYWTVFGVVTIGHLLLIGLGILAIIAFRRRPVLTVVAVQLWMGYGIGAALLAMKDMG